LPIIPAVVRFMAGRQTKYHNNFHNFDPTIIDVTNQVTINYTKINVMKYKIHKEEGGNFQQNLFLEYKFVVKNSILSRA
jgi:hypothetical protein